MKPLKVGGYSHQFPPEDYMDPEQVAKPLSIDMELNTAQTNWPDWYQNCLPTGFGQKGKMWTPKKKDLSDVNPKKKLICWNGLPMVNQKPKFYK